MGTTVTCPTSGTCTFVISPYVATADDYAAVTLIWASILTAACLVMGAKWVYRLFRERGQE